MADTQTAEKLRFLQRHRQADEVTVLAEAMQAGIDVLYREALIEGFLADQIARDHLVQELGVQAVLEVEQQRDALRRDVAWGLNGR
jgi:hypothetical protein